DTTTAPTRSPCSTASCAIRGASWDPHWEPDLPARPGVLGGRCPRSRDPPARILEPHSVAGSIDGCPKLIIPPNRVPTRSGAAVPGDPRVPEQPATIPQVRR